MESTKDWSPILFLFIWPDTWMERGYMGSFTKVWGGLPLAPKLPSEFPIPTSPPCMVPNIFAPADTNCGVFIHPIDHQCWDIFPFTKHWCLAILTSYWCQGLFPFYWPLKPLYFFSPTGHWQGIFFSLLTPDNVTSFPTYWRLPVWLTSWNINYDHWVLNYEHMLLGATWIFLLWGLVIFSSYTTGCCHCLADNLPPSSVNF